MLSLCKVFLSRNGVSAPSGFCEAFAQIAWLVEVSEGAERWESAGRGWGG